MSPYFGPGFPGPENGGSPPEAGARYMSLETSDLDNPQAGVTTYWQLGYIFWRIPSKTATFLEKQVES